MSYTNQQIETAAKALHEYGYHSDWEYVDSEAKAETRGAVAVVIAALGDDTPAPGPDMVTWTPDQGPLSDKLAGLPDGHEVTITAPAVWTPGAINDAAYISFRDVTRAEWLRPAPAWDGALVVLDEDGDLWARLADGLYWYSNGSWGDPAENVESAHGPITVLIDADGHHVEVES